MTPREQAFEAFRAFGEEMKTATSLEEHRARWEAWSARLEGTPETRRSTDSVGGVPVEWVAPLDAKDDAATLVFLHGGGFSAGSPATHRPTTAHLAVATGHRVAVVDYRLFPEHPFPSQMEDAFAVYRALLADGGDPGRIALIGDSAGGGLVISTLLLVRDRGLPMPAAAIGIGPWVDLAVTGGSMLSNANTDPVVMGEQMRAGALRFLGEVSTYDPLASPIYADLTGLPPLLIQVSSSEALLDDARRLAGRARYYGVPCTLSEWPGMVHGWHQFAAFLPEARGALTEISDFLGALGWTVQGGQ